MSDKKTETQHAWHLKPGDMVVLWTFLPSLAGAEKPPYTRRPYLCCSVERIEAHVLSAGNQRSVRVNFLGWHQRDLVLPWDELVELVRRPTD